MFHCKSEMPLPSLPTIMDEFTRYVKTEKFDPNAMSILLRHDGISANEKKMLSLYYKQRINGNHVRVIYDHAADYKAVGAGRLFAEKGLGLQNFK